MQNCIRLTAAVHIRLAYCHHCAYKLFSLYLAMVKIRFQRTVGLTEIIFVQNTQFGAKTPFWRNLSPIVSSVGTLRLSVKNYF